MKNNEINAIDVSKGYLNGEVLWVCDYRQPDLNKKPIRVVKPTKVLVRPMSTTRENIYYSESYFSPLGKDNKPLKKVIKLYDNTGYMSYPGVPLRVFTDEYVCKVAFSDMCVDVIDRSDEWLKEQKSVHNDRCKKLRELSTSALISSSDSSFL